MRKGILMKSERCFAYIAVKLAGVLLTGASKVGVSTPQVRTKEMSNEPTF